MCTDELAMELFKIVNILLKIVKFAIPLLIIVITIMDIGKNATSSGNPDYKGTFNKAGIRLVSAVLIFFIPTIIGIIFRIVDTDYNENNLECLLHVTNEDVQEALVIKADDALIDLESSYSTTKHNEILSTIASITDENIRNTLEKKVEKVNNDYVQSIERKEYEQSKVASERVEKRRNSGTYASLGPNTSGFHGDFIYYSQHNQYANIKYSGGVYNAEGCGCGYVSLAMVIDNLTGSNHTPKDIVNAFPPNNPNYASDKCAIQDELLHDKQKRLQNEFGVTATELFSRNYSTSQAETERRKKILIESLQEGYMIILLVPDHYIVLASIDQNEEIAVYDPGNAARNGKYTIEKLYNDYWDYQKRCTIGNDKGQKHCRFAMAIGYKKI